MHCKHALCMSSHVGHDLGFVAYKMAKVQTWACQGQKWPRANGQA